MFYRIFLYKMFASSIFIFTFATKKDYECSKGIRRSEKKISQ